MLFWVIVLIFKGEKEMKKLFVLAAIFALALTACEQPVDGNSSESKLPSLTIRNESSFVLTDVKFSDISFVISESNELPISSQAVKQLTKDNVNKTGYITFVRKDIGIACRTEPITTTDKDFIFTFLDTTVVEEIDYINNKKTLSQISFLSKITIEQGGLTITKNNTVNLNERIINNPKETVFTIKNTGVGTLLLIGNEPVSVSGSVDVFRVTQPSRPEIEPNDSLTFKIIAYPSLVGNYSATITVNSNDRDGDYKFMITAEAVSSKPIVDVFFEGINIPQNGLIDAGDVMLTVKKTITVEIKNDGTDILVVDATNAVITGKDAALFTKITSPAGSILPGTHSSLVIEYTPDNPGENIAILTIPTNDISRSSVIVYLRTNAFPITYYTVTYDVNGGTGSAPVAQTVLGFSGITLPDGNGLAKAGFVFNGWITNISGTGISYNANINYTVTSNITLYAKWKIDMVWIESGSFVMGSPVSEETPILISMRQETQHHVTLTSGFYMGKHEITQAQYYAVAGNNPSYFWSLRYGDYLPVENVTWYEAVEFCNKLSQQEGLERVYTISDRVPLDGYYITSATVVMDLTKNGYRLPTEAEWEYACRAGRTTAYNTGASIDISQANFNNPDGSTWITGNYPPNAWGLYDMHGNVKEWCWDRCDILVNGFIEYLQDYSIYPQTDPVGSNSGPYRAIRGGSYYGDSLEMRSACRSFGDPSSYHFETGFRVVRK